MIKKSLSLSLALFLLLTMTAAVFAAAPQRPSVKYETTVGSTPIRRYLLHKSATEEYLEDAGTIAAGTTLQVVDELTVNGTEYGIYLDPESDSLAEQPPAEPSPNGPGAQQGGPGRTPPTRPAKGSAPSGPPPAFCFKLEELQASQTQATAAPTEETATTAAEQPTEAAEPVSETAAEEAGDTVPATAPPETTAPTAPATEQPSTALPYQDNSAGQNDDADRLVGLLQSLQRVLLFAAAALAVIVVLIVLLVRRSRKKKRRPAQEEKAAPEKDKTGETADQKKDSHT